MRLTIESKMLKNNAKVEEKKAERARENARKNG